jgi:prevent-host-death family protein
MAWQFHVAKARLGAVVALAQQEEPQVVTVRGRGAAIELSAEVPAVDL